jgi:hypothetical protein
MATMSLYGACEGGGGGFISLPLRPIFPALSSKDDFALLFQFFHGGVVVCVIDTSGKFAASIVDTDGKFATSINNTSRTGGKIFPRCRRYKWCTLTCKFLRKFSSAWGKMIHGKI